MKLKGVDEVFAADLRNPDYAAGYVNLSLEDDGVEGLLYSLQKVAKARGMTRISKASGINREGLYRCLSPTGNPTIKSLQQVTSALGLRLAILPASLEHFELNETSSDAPSSQPDLDGIVSDLKDQIESLRSINKAMRRAQPISAKKSHTRSAKADRAYAIR